VKGKKIEKTSRPLKRTSKKKMDTRRHGLRDLA